MRIFLEQSEIRAHRVWQELADGLGIFPSPLSVEMRICHHVKRRVVRICQIGRWRMGTLSKHRNEKEQTNHKIYKGCRYPPQAHLQHNPSLREFSRKIPCAGRREYHVGHYSHESESNIRKILFACRSELSCCLSPPPN